MHTCAGGQQTESTKGCSYDLKILSHPSEILLGINTHLYTYIIVITPKYWDFKNQLLH